MRGCTFWLPPSKARIVNLVRHLHSHYPDAYFCPVCEHTFRTREALCSHITRIPKAPRIFKKSKAPLWKRKSLIQEPAEDGVRIDYAKEGERNSDIVNVEVVHDSDGDDSPEACCASAEALWFEVGRDQERFNIYWLGMMEKWKMPDEHFELIAGRRRGEAP